MKFKPDTPQPKLKQLEHLFDTPIDERTGALKTAYGKDLAELVTGEQIEELPVEDEPDRMYESTSHREKNEGISKYICDLLKDKVVVDLGCGVQTTGYKISNFARAKQYTGVEKNFAKSASERITEIATKHVPFEVVQQSMLNYVKDPSHKADIVFLIGIDTLIIPLHEWNEFLRDLNNTLSENGSVLIGGGGEKPWDLIEKYFDRDENFNKIRSTMELMSANVPSIWKKKKVSQDRLK